MTFSASDCAFEGFRLARRTPMTILIWALAYIVFTAFCFIFVGGSFVALMAAATELQGVAQPSMDQLQPLMAAYAGMAWILPLAIVFGAVTYTAVVRAVLQPEQKGLGYMRLGMDEVRVFVVYLVLSILAVIAAVVIYGVAGVIGGVAGAAAGDAAGMIALVLMIAATAVFVWLLVRFSLAIPITFDQKKFAIFDSWGVTRGRALGLFGMTLIVIVMALVVSILTSIIVLPLTFMFGGMANLAALEGAGMGEIMSAMGPAIVIYVIYNGIVSALMLAILYAPYAAAYRDIRGETASTPVSPAPAL